MQTYPGLFYLDYLFPQEQCLFDRESSVIAENVWIYLKQLGVEKGQKDVTSNPWVLRRSEMGDLNSFNLPTG